MPDLSRRNFVKNSAVTALGLSILPSAIQARDREKRNVKIGIIGTGNRGTSLLTSLLKMEGNDIVAVCDLFQQRADNAAGLCVKAGKKRPKVYCKDETTYAEMLDKETQLDAVLIPTYWEYHTPIALHAM